jgi:hypothetical protein
VAFRRYKSGFLHETRPHTRSKLVVHLSRTWSRFALTILLVTGLPKSVLINSINSRHKQAFHQLSTFS